MNTFQLVKAINIYLQSERYLVILDDVWKLDLWDDLSVTLPNSSHGSRILITTRDERVANGFGNEGRVYPLSPLNEEEAWNLFVKKAFWKEPCSQALQPLAQKIVKKCGGVPLAIAALGGLLSSKGRTRMEWENFYNTINWELSNNKQLQIVEKVLSLSYDSLPCHLKPCFLYFSIFPEDHLIKRKRLIRLWVANDFIKERPNMTKEEVADEYLKELIQRSMLQAVETNDLGRVRICRIHDMMRELALSISKELNFCKVYDKEEASLHCNDRHLAIHKCGEYIQSSKGMTKIHSLIVFDRVMPSLSILDILSPIFKFLKVLDLEGLNITSLPDSLCDLYLVRYLSLRYTKVKDLPESIGRLQNLETLDVRHTEVTKLPKSALQLPRLRNLFIYRASTHVYKSFEHFSGGVVEKIESLNNLQCLVDIEASDEIVKQIGCLTQLRRLEISKVKRGHGNDLCRSIEKMRKLVHLSIWAIDENELLELDALSDLPSHLQQIHLGGRLEKVPEWFWDVRKYHLVSWEQVCQPTADGGLGVRPISAINDALLTKWLWRLGTEGDSIWKAILICKYRLGNWDVNPVVRRASGMWRAITACVDKFRQGIRFKVGRGDKIMFWSDLSCDRSPLATRFPSLYRLSLRPRGAISDFYCVSGNQCVWDVPLRRNLPDPDDQSLSTLLNLISSYRIRINEEDSLTWWPDGNGVFSVKSFYSWRSSSTGIASVNPKIWSSKAPPRAIGFFWTAGLGNILTQDNLQRRGKTLVSACPFCLRASEESNHLLIHCRFSFDVWCSVLDQFGMAWVMPSTLAEVSFAWDIISVSPKCALLWHLSPFAIIWSLWWEMNNRLFRDTFKSSKEVASRCLSMCAAWAVNLQEFRNISISDILRAWKECVELL